MRVSHQLLVDLERERPHPIPTLNIPANSANAPMTNPSEINVPENSTNAPMAQITKAQLGY
jgi:hypothetical protein